jgi:pimeloyl-ACP methyl ester carboxylesterase
MSFDVARIKMFGLPGIAVALLLAAGCSRGAEAPASSPAPEPPATLSDVGADSRAFSVASADGTQITGQVDAPIGADGREPVVVLSAGTGLFDRDVKFSNSGTERDAVFADLARRFTKAGIAVVRYDRRGVRYKPADGQMLDKAVSGTSTVETQRDDLAAVYDLARGESACVALLGHSEGAQHIANLAVTGAPAPDMVVGIGASLQAPADVFKWQSAERDAFSLRMMDADGDGTTTNDEVRANLETTPSAAYGMLAPFLHPDGEWTPEALDQLVVTQAGLFETGKAQALAMDPDAPFPDANTPMAKYSWWQNWYTEDVPAAEKLAVWDVPMLFYYGNRDSQVRYEFQQPAAGEALGGRAEIHILPGLGHSLGSHALYGPMDEAAADALVARTAAILAERCAP